MKIPYLVGIVIAIVGIIALIGLTQDSTDDSQNKIRVAFFPSIVHAVPIIGMETQTFADNLHDDLDIEIKIFDSGPQVIESLFSNSISASLCPVLIISCFLSFHLSFALTISTVDPYAHVDTTLYMPSCLAVETSRAAVNCKCSPLIFSDNSA